MDITKRDMAYRAVLLVRHGPITPAKLAEHCGISVQSVYRWVTEARHVPIEHVGKVSDITGLPLWQLRPDRPDLFPPPIETTANRPGKQSAGDCCLA